MHFSTVIAKNLLRRPLRSALTIFGLGVSIAAFVALVGMARGFERSFLDYYSERGVDLIVQRASSGVEKFNNGLPEKCGPKLAQVPGVQQVLGRLLDLISFEKDGILNVIIAGIAVDSPLLNRLTVTSGRGLQSSDRHKAILGRILSAELDKVVGDTIDLYSEKFEIVGIYESPTTYENGGVVILLEELQRLMNRPHEVSGFTITAVHPLDEQGLEALRQRIEAVQPGLQATSTGEFVQNFVQLRLTHAVAWLISAIAVIVGAIGMLNTMIMSVFERTKEFGILRAIGWRRGRIVRLVVGEALFLSTLGAVLGSVGGILGAKLLSRIPSMSVFSEGDVAASVIIEGFVAALIVGLAGAIYPALWSASLLPTEALRR